MARDIKTRFVLEGEQKFRSAMKDSANAIKVLNSEEKLAKAQFQQTGDAQKYAAQQAEILKQKIAEQKSAVAAAEEAIRQLTENGVAENSRQMQQWRIRLNDAQTALTRMQTDLASLGNESSEAASETENLGDSLQSLDKKASLDAVLNSVNRLSDGLGNALNKVKELATGLVTELREAAAWADDLATTAIVYGMDTQTLQRMQFAAQLVDTDVETIIKSRQKLEQAMKSARPSLGTEEFEKGKTSVNEYEKAFAQLGVEIMRYGQYRDWEDVFWETGDKLMHMADGLDDVAKANAEVIRDTTAQQLFGKSWRELLPLFTAGREGYQAAMDSAATVSDENIGKLTALDDALQKLRNQFETMERTVLASLAPTLTQLSDALSKLMAEFNEYLQTEEGQQMLSDLGEAVGSLFEDITNADFGAALQTVKDALGQVQTALVWIKDNRQTVVDAIKAIVGAWMALKVTSGMTTVLQLINGLKGLGPNTPVVPNNGPAPAVSSTPKGTPVVPAGGGSAVSGFATKVGTSAVGRTVGNLAASGIGDLLGAGTMGVIALGDKTEFGRTLRDGGSLKEALDASASVVRKTFSEDNLNEFKSNWDPSNPNANIIARWVGDVSTRFREGTDTPESILTKQRESANRVTEQLSGSDPELEAAWQLFAEDVNSSTSATTAELLKTLAGHYQTFLEDEDPMMAALLDNLSEETGDALTSALDTIWSGEGMDPFDAAELVNRVRNELESVLSEKLSQTGANVYGEGEVVGANASIGVANGINGNADAAIGAAQALADAVSATLRSALKISSPSRVMMELGSYVSQGFAEGIESQLSVVNRAAERMTGIVNLSPGAGGFGGRNGGMIDVALYLGPDRLTEIMTPLMDDAMGEEIALMRR